MRNNNLIRAIAAVLVVAFVSGCATPQPVVQTKLITPEDAWLVDCEVSPPPAQEAYMHEYSIAPLENAKVRERLMAKYARTLLSEVAVCNKRFGAMREWKTKSLKAVVPISGGK